MAEPKWRPLLFKAPMVVAIQEGRKLQTMRLVGRMLDGRLVDNHFALGPKVKRAPKVYTRPMALFSDGSLALERAAQWCPYGVPGDRLWGRETWYCDHMDAKPQGSVSDVLTWRKQLYYRADYATDAAWSNTWEAEIPGWRPAIFMPKWACRIFLEITSVRVHRLQDITEAEARLEGFPLPGPQTVRLNGKLTQVTYFDALTNLGHLWNEINPATPWASNPYVWAISFKRIKGW